MAQGNPRELGERVMGASRIVAEIKADQAQATSAIQALDSVDELLVTQVGDWLRLRIKPPPGRDIREEVLGMIVSRGWPVREIRREVASLEDYFVQIIAQQHTHQKQAG